MGKTGPNRAAGFSFWGLGPRRRRGWFLKDPGVKGVRHGILKKRAGTAFSSPAFRSALIGWQPPADLV